MEEGAPQLHERFPGNVLKHTDLRRGNYAEAIKEPGLIKVEKWYDTPTVQHCHIENFGCFAYEENGRIVVVTSTQIPHIVRRVVGQALGRPWGDIEIIKPYIGGGFGNKQDTLYEPLAAWLCMQVGGRTVKLDIPREDTFISNRIRHAERFHITSWVRADGTVVAVGSNYNGQCDVDKWKDIVAVSAGDTHTVGLCADGTVVAGGYNAYGQCDVSDWKNIKVPNR
jgi:xanthine dehydrogenase molybdenum-binding subunit